MNNPYDDPFVQIAWLGAHGFDFVDYTHEPPKANLPLDKVDEFTGCLNYGLKGKGNKLDVVGHSAYYLPFDSPYPEVVEAATKICLDSLDFVAKVGAKKFTIHFMPGQTQLSREKRIKMHIEFLSNIINHADGIKIMLENSPTGGSQVIEFREILRELPQLGLHLDVAHAWIIGKMKEINALLSLGRPSHLHVSENDGKTDLHNPLGTAYKFQMPWKEIIRRVKETGYDDTVTLEVFSPRKTLLLDSKTYFEELWHTTY